MLKSWSIQNFKPTLNSGKLRLAPVTILTGRNGSGKSSLIQSILMIAQTLSSASDRVLLLNGPLVQLGMFDDVLNEQANSRTLIVGFELEMGKERLRDSRRIVGTKSIIESRIYSKSIKAFLQFHCSTDDEANGPGISQVLPILIMGLIASSNTLLIVEQPELHLHPSVQARLGDFFIELAKCDKQCLIETHSENLVSQLRYHIVQEGEQEGSDCLIYFVDQDERGATRFNPIEISAQGNILNWPDGFFDETMLQEDRITAASLKKRAAHTHNG